MTRHSNDEHGDLAVAEDGGLYVEAELISPGPAATSSPATTSPTSPATPATAPEAESCPNCQACTITREVPWCSQCGFYPRLNIFVEPDAPTATAGATTAPRQAWQYIPLWVYVLLLGCIGVIAGSIAARMMIPATSIVRPLWAIGQCLLGLLIFSAMHLAAYLYAIIHDSQMGLFDIVLRPLKVWAPTVRALPQTARRLCLAAWSLLAAVLALTVIGGIPYHLLWEMGPEEQAKVNLVHAIVDQARQAEQTDQNMEEAINDFVGKATDDNQPAPLDETPKPPARNKKLDCLILGYKPQGDSDFSELILAGVDQGKLQIVGSVDTKYIAPEVRQELMAAMAAHTTDEPFLKTSFQAKWVAPIFTCRIGFNGWSSNRKMQDAVFYKRLADVKQ